MSGTQRAAQLGVLGEDPQPWGRVLGGTPEGLGLRLERRGHEQGAWLASLQGSEGHWFSPTEQFHSGEGSPHTVLCPRPGCPQLRDSQQGAPVGLGLLGRGLCLVIGLEPGGQVGSPGLPPEPRVDSGFPPSCRLPRVFCHMAAWPCHPAASQPSALVLILTVHTEWCGPRDWRIQAGPSSQLGMAAWGPACPALLP